MQSLSFVDEVEGGSVPLALVLLQGGTFSSNGAEVKGIKMWHRALCYFGNRLRVNKKSQDRKRDTEHHREVCCLKGT